MNGQQMEPSFLHLGAIANEVPTGTVEHVMDALVRVYEPGEGALLDEAMRALGRSAVLKSVVPGRVRGDTILSTVVDHVTEQGVAFGEYALSVFCPRWASAPRAVADAIAAAQGRRIAWVVRTTGEEHLHEVALVEEGEDWPAGRVRFTIIDEGEIGGGPLLPAEPDTPGDRPFFAPGLRSEVALCLAEQYVRAVRQEMDAASAAVARAMLNDLERRGVGRERMDALRALIAEPVDSADG